MKCEKLVFCLLLKICSPANAPSRLVEMSVGGADSVGLTGDRSLLPNRCRNCTGLWGRMETRMESCGRLLIGILA